MLCIDLPCKASLPHTRSLYATFLQGKRKSSKPPPKKIMPRVDTTFSCPFCNHSKAVVAKMDHLTENGLVECTVCGQKYSCKITSLSEPIDVYSDWIDACERANSESRGVINS